MTSTLYLLTSAPAVSSFAGNPEVDHTAQFFTSPGLTHQLKKLLPNRQSFLTEHLALYAGNNSDFRGKAAYWAARDSERAGKLAEARPSIRNTGALRCELVRLSGEAAAR
jgi:hypothetical protein